MPLAAEDHLAILDLIRSPKPRHRPRQSRNVGRLFHRGRGVRRKPGPASVELRGERDV